MNESSKKVLNYLTGYPDINAVTVEDLQKLAADNPYFPVTQLLLAEKLKDESDEQYTRQATKTSLYFSNPYWLKYQLTQHEFQGEMMELEPPEILTENENKPVLRPGVSVQQPEATSKPLPAIPINIEEKSLGMPAEGKPEDTFSDDFEEIETGETEISLSYSEVSELPAITQVEEEQAIELRNTNDASDNFINNLDTNTASTTADKQDLLTLPANVETEAIELKEEMAGVTHGRDATTERFIQEAHENLHNEEPPQDDEHDRMFQNIKAMLDASSEEAGADTKDAVIPMDPYYTVDYFASQGIKLELDQNPQDQLGQNLKKFTQWLKHMKKLGPEDATEVINRTESEADIQQIADSSNTVREVVTEAMAMVLEKQGKKDKAVELYNKLSFLNPNKRAYFVSKIKILKGI